MTDPQWTDTEAKLLKAINELIGVMPQAEPDDRLAGFFGAVTAAANLGPDRTIEALRRMLQSIERCPVTISFQKEPDQFVVYSQDGKAALVTKQGDEPLH